MSWDRVIKVIVPTREEIDAMNKLGIGIETIESHLVKSFIAELRMRLHPEEKDEILKSLT